MQLLIERKIMNNIYYFGGTWGDKIGAGWAVKNEDIGSQFSIAGFKSTIPKENDYLVGNSGETILIYKLTEIDRMDNPRDMFFAKATYLIHFEKEDVGSITVAQSYGSIKLSEALNIYDFTHKLCVMD